MNHHCGYKFKCQKNKCTTHQDEKYHCLYNQRYIEESKIKNTVNSINNFYLSNYNAYPTLEMLLKDLKL